VSPLNAAIQTVDLYEVVQIKLNGSGNGTASITPVGPRGTGVRWQLAAVAVKVATNTAEAGCVCYVSYGQLNTADISQKGNTSLGSTGDTCGLSVTLRPGDYVSCKWTGGDANAVATMILTGTIYPPGTY
jgi:hypothetical protein